MKLQVIIGGQPFTQEFANYETILEFITGVVGVSECENQEAKIFKENVERYKSLNIEWLLPANPVKRHAALMYRKCEVVIIDGRLMYEPYFINHVYREYQLKLLNTYKTTSTNYQYQRT